MAKTVALTYEGKEYTLEFTRETVRQMERRGFKLSEVAETPMTVVPELFAGAFRANHPRLDRGLIDEILDSLPDVRELIGVLCEMYNEPLETLLNGAAEEDGGKASWAASWEKKN